MTGRAAGKGIIFVVVKPVTFDFTSKTFDQSLGATSKAL